MDWNGENYSKKSSQICSSENSDLLFSPILHIYTKMFQGDSVIQYLANSPSQLKTEISNI